MPELSVKKLNIVYVVARFHPFKGGAEQNCLQLAKRSAAQGHSVTVLTTDISPDNSKLPSQENYLGINIVRLKSWNNQLTLGFYPGLLTKLLNTKADVIHVENGPGFIWQEFCLFWKRILSRNTLFIATPHGGFIVTPETHTGLKLFVAKLAKLIASPYFKLLWPFLFDVVIAVNPKQHIWMQNDYRISEHKIVVLPNCIDANIIITNEQLAAKKQALADKPITITCIGRMAKYKGFQYVISALGQLKEQGKLVHPVRLVIMGRSEAFTQELSQLKNDLNLAEIEIISSPTNELRDQILTEQSQIHVLPSHFEATGIVLLEAMAKGNAIISSDGNEAAEALISNSENGFIFANKDVSDLAEKLAAIIDDADLRWQMIGHNLEKVKMFTWEKVFPEYLDLINSKIGNRKS